MKPSIKTISLKPNKLLRHDDSSGVVKKLIV